MPTGHEEIIPALLVSYMAEPHIMVRDARQVWKNVEPRDRVIMIAPRYHEQVFPFRADLAELIVQGPDMSEFDLWWPQIVAAWAQADLLPARAALDFEKGFSYWQLDGRGGHSPQTQFARAWNNPKARAALPPPLRETDPGSIHWKTQREAVIRWNQFALEHRNRALQEAFGMPLLDAKPDTRITNWQDVRSDSPVYDARGWPYSQVSMSDESSPSLYHPDPEVNLQRLRTIIASDGPLPVPWIPYPSYMGQDAWEQTVRGAVALGVQEFLYWNPFLKSEQDDAFAAMVFADLHEQNRNQQTGAFD
jgi:hypothetical protein